MGVAYNPRIVTDGLVACYDLGNIFRNTTTYTTTNFLQNGSFAGGLGVTYAFADGAGSNPTNTIVELENPGDSNYVLRQNGNQPFSEGVPEYQMNIDGGAQGTLSANTQYVMSGWYATSDDYNGGDTMFHARAFSTGGSHNATGNGIGTLLYSVEVGGLTWEYRYQTITTPSDYSGDFDWYLGYGTQNSAGYRYYTGLRVEKGSFPSLVDLSKNFTDATVFNGPSFTNSNGGYLTFDALDDYIDLGSTITMSRAGATCDFWMNRNTFTRKSLLTYLQGSYISHVEVGENNFITETKNNCNVFDSPTFTFNINQWYHICFKFESNRSYWYVNGEYIGETSNYGLDNCQTNPRVEATELLADFDFRYIGENVAYSGHYSGSLASFKVYDRALSNDEVKQNFNATRGRFGI